METTHFPYYTIVKKNVVAKMEAGWSHKKRPKTHGLLYFVGRLLVSLLVWDRHDGLHGIVIVPIAAAGRAGLFLTIHIWHIVFGHEAGKDSHDHLVLDLNNILRQCIDPGSNTTSHGEGVFGIGEILLQNKNIIKTKYIIDDFKVVFLVN